MTWLCIEHADPYVEALERMGFTHEQAMRLVFPKTKEQSVAIR